MFILAGFRFRRFLPFQRFRCISQGTLQHFILYPLRTVISSPARRWLCKKERPICVKIYASWSMYFSTIRLSV